MDERMRFVIRLKDGETMAALCREFGISRKTGYKIFERYEQCGLEGLSDRARRPFRYANQLPEQVEAAIVSAKREKPHWGARKIRERLLRQPAGRVASFFKVRCMRSCRPFCWGWPGRIRSMEIPKRSHHTESLES